VKKLDGPSLSKSPDADEIEVSLFGPGFGESVVVHLTRGVWITVDSCLDKQTLSPAAASYFDTVGVDKAQDVRFVIASHWHDDHVRGIGTLFEECKSAQFVCAHGLQGDQFKGLVGLYSKYFGSGGSGLNEFTKVMRVLKNRRRANSLIGPEFASASTIIFESNMGIDILIKALAPSSPAVAAGVAKFVEDLLPRSGQKRSRVPSLGQNDLALAITLRVANLRILLGADLEEDGRAGMGWREVVSRFGSIDKDHQGIKVPHHGSVTGHSDDVWSEMLIPQPWAVVTPYSRTNPPLPTARDLERIGSLASDLFVTAQKHQSRFTHPNPTVRKQLREMGVVISEEPAAQGLVRLRKKVTNPSGEWTVELFGDARHIVPEASV
jgi:hypothetical protein